MTLPRPMIRSALAQRMLGTAMLIVCLGFTAWNWYTALRRGYYYEKAALLFPAFGAVALGLLIFPIDADELNARYGVDRIQKWQQLPRSWQILVIAGIAAAAANAFAMSRLQVGS